MGQYVAPIRDMQFVLHEFLNVTEEFKNLPKYQEIDTDIINQVLEEGAKFTQEVLFPLNHSGDREGCTFNAADKSVTTPKGFKQAYKQYVEGGWAALACDPEYGGQGLPITLNNSFYEMLNSSNQAWSMYPGLSHGAYECLLEHGTDDQKRLYLPKLVSGEWTGTMCLTEAHCGTDLGLLRSKAEPQGDGTYLITGSKIFISAGEHDISDNIVHLVLARLPDAPEGSKGISLFLVPKFMPNEDGSIGERNGIACGAIEEKMGIHGNSTCQMNLDNARATLIGQPHKGLQAMFVFMNAARLGVGMQSLGLTEVAYQNALAYAKDRIQMRSLSGVKAPDKPADPIIVHPDVRRMLLTAKAFAEGGRAFSSYVALQIDRELNHTDEDVRKEAADEVALLTPIIKAFITDNGWIATSEAMQVYGGHGYIAEWGMEQYVRDARINMIYEGTNTIQSLDLLGRKILMDNGAKLRKFGEKIKSFVEDNGLDENMSEFVTPLGELGDKVTKLTMEIGMKAFQNPDEVGAAAVPYLRVAGHLVYSYLFAQQAKIALAKLDSGDRFYESKLATIRFYFARLYPETAMLIRQARSGAANLTALDADLF
ncbi:acyl-CoA dehydrogenase C-terminal domain-containing protein [Oxalobacteraceae sp. CFBP 13730]|jgi:alkylation response protein AidB-like acyl-CoA dehydrogenase|uniref:3-methylmercaptopropionyl-CoA dehydrogenase n=1 Tax=Massilia aurea TaxID=373040 RepID=A0A7X0CE39_9BURK|nr:acyl-CoA dehydrogenase C-terminal domain-containing protein [Massilia aurea]MBB6133931.1 alkylation response protein AidB-like acyl-CoA dehydrogenase [Massilia aurea]MBD8629509.1 acyl-CoA dehydrogenase C-terminal domain-containing protein [Oxalobacteraceae sp. CFBP 8753]MBD8634015.1 acyl-CoA dehydrogenase C-terminal domain-containing protein [Oxalobacteraceae sp. CFBP 8755]MBD8657963.1 acyl-CoA dehydrogenase C-terminal domain-containing protein [Oxalobacteraceae sp. CFBP 13730]